MRRTTFLAVSLVFSSSIPAVADARDSDAARGLRPSSLESWINLDPAGPIPPARRDPGVTYDSRGDRLVVIGGAGGGNATWLLNLAGTPTWTSIAETSPPNVSGDDRAVYDRVNNRVVLVTSSMQVWALDLANPGGWSLLAAGSPPPPRRFYAAAHDARRNKLLIFAGLPDTGLFNDVWALPLSGISPTWTRIVVAGTAPAPRWAPTAIYDAARDRLIVTSGSLSAGGYAVTNDVWALSLGEPAWTLLSPGGTSPRPRMLAGAVNDPSQDRLLLYGGFSGSSALGDVWGLSLGDSVEWIELSPAGTSPPPRWSYGAAYRTAVPQMIIYGGWDGGSALSDAWALETVPATGPPVVLGFAPLGGRVGDLVTVRGLRLQNPLDVHFNGVSAPILSATLIEISTLVPDGATTGPIRVVTPEGESTSADNFFVGETPEIIAAIPDSGKVGATVTVVGRHFTGASRVSFGSRSDARFSVSSDRVIVAFVDSAATTAPISITTPAATGASAFAFKVLPFDTAARIVSVRDIPADQGGRVAVRWLRSDLDVAPRREIAGYRVWRRAPIGLAATDAARHLNWRQEVLAGEVVFWEPMAVIPASYLEGYAFVAATTRDSMEGGNPYTAFFIQTLTADPFVFYNSAVDSGYSVDNLPPRRPSRFTAEYGASGNRLHWGGNSEPDLWQYRLYRGGELTFEPGPDNLIYAGPDTTMLDAASLRSVYKLSAVDIHGNESRFALATPGGSMTGVAFMVSARVEPTRVALRWYAVGLPGALLRVYRRIEAASWQVMGTVVADAVGMVDYSDNAVQPGQRLGYRLGMMEGDVEVFSEVTWVTVPDARLAILDVVPNPIVSAESFSVRLSLPRDGSSTLHVFDVSGRVAARRDLRSLSAGIHEVRVVWEGRPAPGIYWVRLIQASSSVARKFGVLR